MTRAEIEQRVLREVERARDELVDFTRDLIRIPTVNPPGDVYRDCAEAIGAFLASNGMAVEYIEAEGRPEHTATHPRVNVVGRTEGQGGPAIHLNGHFDVVPAGDGWTVDPFGGVVRDGRIFGRGASDMKSGLAAAAVAVAALGRAGVVTSRALEVSGTVDEESGGWAGVAHLCEMGRISAERTAAVIIPEPFGPERICVGHKGVHWIDITAHGEIAHGCMPYLGRSAIDDMAALLLRLETRLGPVLAARVTDLPVVPEGSRRPSLNVNSVLGGQAGEEQQTPCVADRCVAILDRRFIPEESIEAVRQEISEVIDEVSRERGGARFVVAERMTVLPVQAPVDSPLITALETAIHTVTGRTAERVGSPGTYDQKHVARIGGLEHCVAYGPGPLEEAHQPDESCSIDDLVTSAQVMALAVLDLADVDSDSGARLS